MQNTLTQHSIDFPNLFSGISLPIGPVAFRLFGLEVYWYGIIITAAVVLGIAYAIKFAWRAGLLPDNVFEIAFWGVLGGVIGARAYYVIFWNLNPETFPNYTFLTAITGIRDGGLAIYGGLIGSLIAVLIATKFIKVKVAPFADLIGLGFLIGHCIGRWGNFFNQEAFGSPTAGNLPWGMTGDVISHSPPVIEAQRELGITGLALVHPCFLYESLWCLIGFVLLHFYLKRASTEKITDSTNSEFKFKWFRKTFDGEIFLLYIVWYGMGRAMIEALRLDSLMLGSLRVSQVLAIASAVFALGALIYFKKMFAAKIANGDYILFKDTEESKVAVEEYLKKVKVDKEKEEAKSEFKKAHRELNDPFAESIIDEDVIEDIEEMGEATDKHEVEKIDKCVEADEADDVKETKEADVEEINKDVDEIAEEKKDGEIT